MTKENIYMEGSKVYTLQNSKERCNTNLRISEKYIILKQKIGIAQRNLKQKRESHFQQICKKHSFSKVWRVTNKTIGTMVQYSFHKLLT